MEASKLAKIMRMRINAILFGAMPQDCSRCPYDMMCRFVADTMLNYAVSRMKDSIYLVA